MKSDLSNVKVGDSIWTIQEGFEKVTEIDKSKHPIRTKSCCYTLKGQVYEDDIYPSAFLTNPFVDEEFIKEAYSEACPKWQDKLKEKFPEVFKSELEVGRWYKGDRGVLAFATKIKSNTDFFGYGFSYDHREWMKEDETSWYNKNWTLATEPEVSEALINEAKKRGFKEGVSIITVDNSYPCKIDTYDSKNIEFEIDYPNSLNFGNKCIYKDGAWAEIIPTVTELTLEQIADKFGIDVNTLKIKK